MLNIFEKNPAGAHECVNFGSESSTTGGRSPGQRPSGWARSGRVGLGWVIRSKPAVGSVWVGSSDQVENLWVRSRWVKTLHSVRTLMLTVLWTLVMKCLYRAWFQNTLATWLKWTTKNPGPDNRLGGSVCGQDPRFVQDWRIFSFFSVARTVVIYRNKTIIEQKST